MKHFYVATAFALTIASSMQAQNSQEQDSAKREQLEQVVLKATRVNSGSPVTYSNLTKEDLKSRNLGQDLPILLNYLPNVVTTSDAGAGIGYTGIRVRGSDATRVNVTINGVPYNDSESQGTFWVNLPDFASSVDNVQLQRGVGSSTNGSGAFGASLNIKTLDYNPEAGVKVGNSFGSFNSRRHNVQFTTGLLNNQWEFSGRASQLYSDGYIDRASSDLKSYFMSGSYIGDKTLVKLSIFGGEERTYQAYYGVDRATLNSARTTNFAGFYTDANGEDQFYNDQVDNYNQDHYHLAISHNFSDAWSGSATLHYTKGRGYFQEYQESDFFSDDSGRTMFQFYGLQPFTQNGTLVTSSDLETRRWLDNEFYGIVSNLNYSSNKIDASFGFAANQYDGLHYGEIVAGSNIILNSPLQRFYTGFAEKQDVNAFAKANFKITEVLSTYIDLQQRFVSYETNGQNNGFVDFITDKNFSFFNPKAGVVLDLKENKKIYASVSRAQREPNRDDFRSGTPIPEDLIDYELGYRYKKGTVDLNVNGYYMDYKNQLVLSGAIDNQGSPLRTNSGESYRLGIEIDARIKLSNTLYLQPNASFSQNQNKNFIRDNFDGTATALGNTEISYSPSVVAGNAFTYKPSKAFEISLLSKYVGDQFLDNTEDEVSKLDAYFVNDLNAQYIWQPTGFVKEIALSALVNNIFNVEYESNGYAGGFFFPQAGTNFLLGATVSF